ncbi:MAG: polymer-forming cytoskeletal family protein, partial [Caulobacter sp.]
TAQSVRLYGTARVDGDITHEQLAMEPGAEFQGRSLKFRRPAPSPQPGQPAAAAQAPAAPQAPPSASQTPYNHSAH